jgi:predicted AlkP superfamily phosphohydrolase/phosphomutase
MVVSDHGASADGPPFNPYEPLIAKGLATMTAVPPKASTSEDGEIDFGAFWADRENAFFRFNPDMSKCKALPQRELFVYVNLKGRNPGGIVEPEDYDNVVREIIDALLTYVDPATGRRPVQLALSRRDAAVLGLCGDTEQVGDVVYAIDPSYAAQHGPMLPSATYGEFGDLRGILIMQGPGLKKGYRMTRRCSLPDVVPTICYLTDMPLPAQAEGCVLYEALRDPNMKNTQLEKMHQALTRMETALSRENREPWDKHDCA